MRATGNNADGMFYDGVTAQHAGGFPYAASFYRESVVEAEHELVQRVRRGDVITGRSVTGRSGGFSEARQPLAPEPSALAMDF